MRFRLVPIGSTLAACSLSLLPIVAEAAYIPDFGLLTLLAWRLLRPEMWSVTTALPLGLFNDLVSGHPLGQSMAIWTLLFLVLDYLDTRSDYRDYWLDWLLAAAGITIAATGGWIIAHYLGSEIGYMMIVPQILVSILLLPVVALLVAWLDRWRLS